MAGHIKLDRRILKWEWYSDANTCRLFIHLLLTANHKEGRWQGYTIGRGQLITGLLKLNEDTGLTIRQLRTSFEKLKMTGELTIKTTNKTDIYYTIPRVLLENDYNPSQCIDFIANKLATENVQTYKINNTTLFITWKYAIINV